MEAPAYTYEPLGFAGPVPWRRRLPLLASVLWVAALGVWLTGAREPRVWLGLLVSFAVGLTAARQPSRQGRALWWGVAIVLASLGPRGDYLALQASGAMGVAVSAAAACVAITRIPSAGGFFRAPRPSAVTSIVAIVTFWCAAILVRVAPPSDAVIWTTRYPRVLAATASGLVLLAEVERTLRRRGIELGIAERVVAMRSMLWMSSATAVVAAVLGHVKDDAIAQLSIAAASIVVSGAALHVDAVRVARTARRVVVLTIAGGGLALLGASAVGGGGSDTWVTLVVTVGIAVAIGSAAGAIEAPLRPARGSWLDAFLRANAETSRAEPEDAIRGVLMALRTPAGLSSPSPELWTFVPPTAIKVDAAGYLHGRDAQLPEAVVAAAAGEPEGTLRAEVLDLLAVRRPDLRPFAKWMADREALLATVVAYDGESEGLLVLFRVDHGKPTTLEEVRALKNVADRLAAACRARAVRARMLTRATHADEQAQSACGRTEELLRERALCMGRDSLAAARLAQQATVGGYSAESRMALEALERHTATGAPVAVVAPRGVDPVPYLARAHLAGARSNAPMVVIDAMGAHEHDVERWVDPRTSPLALADRGMLVLLDGAALPIDLQQLVARALAENRPPWDRAQPIDIQLAFTAVLAPEQLVAQTRLDPTLALCLADTRASVVVLPRLRDRVEDLRAIIVDRLARDGLGLLGRPVGIEHAAYARLIEYPFPGEDAELAVIVQSLVARCRGDVVRLADVDALRLAMPSTHSSRRGSAAQRKSTLRA